jgi:hypothetical protein
MMEVVSMAYQEIFEKLRKIFTDFGNELGFQEWYVVKEEYYVEVYLRKEHALRLYAELPDTYISIFVTRSEKDAPPASGHGITDSGCLQHVDICSIYHADYPRYPGECFDSEEALLYVLNQQIEMVRKDPQVLLDFIAHIDAHTTPEHAKEYARQNISESIKHAEQDYHAGKIDQKTFQGLVEIAVNELKKYI